MSLRLPLQYRQKISELPKQGIPSRCKTYAGICSERQSSLGHALPLNAYLLKPVQRILKYHLFIDVSHFRVPRVSLVDELQNMLRELESSRADAASVATVKRALEEMTAQVNLAFRSITLLTDCEQTCDV